MTDGINEDNILENVEEMTTEERAEAWTKWVRSEVNSALDIYLDRAISGHINVRYYPHVIEMLESGPQTDDTKADGVLLSIVFEFENPLDLQKPRIEDEPEE
jgi:hypothetical protein